MTPARAAQCEGKEQFPTWTVASKVASKQRVDVYRCEWCGFYHIGKAR